MKSIKSAFRKEIKQRISALDEKYLEKTNKIIYDTVSVLPEVIKADKVFIFCSMDREIDTRRLIDFFLKSGKSVALPVCINDKDMVFNEIKPGDRLKTGMYGLLEPPDGAAEAEVTESSVIITPSLTFDRQGYRMGKGKGYYDRWLDRHKIFSIGLARELLLVDEVPREPFDARVDCLVTENGAKYF
jgi:5-formyltetrahydrofolate cyclo-ligase